MLKEIAKEKLSEVIKAIVPIVAIVLILSVTIVPMPTHVVMVFFYGCILLMIGMVFFTIGSEQAMEPMGKQVGARITKTRKLYLILPLGLLLGFMITISEPDLQVLANQVQSIPNSVLIMSVSGGVAFFLVMALVRMVLGIPLQRVLLVFYVIAFVLAYYTPRDFLAVAFDSGGVTTGPMTVPFIMAFGVGVSALRGTKHSAQDSFGLIALCSIGPIIAVHIPCSWAVCLWMKFRIRFAKSRRRWCRLLFSLPFSRRFYCIWKRKRWFVSRMVSFLRLSVWFCS